MWRDAASLAASEHVARSAARLLAQASEALGMDAYGDIRIDPDGPKQCQSLDDGGECLSAGLAG